jgi:hypothetical protein
MGDRGGLMADTSIGYPTVLDGEKRRGFSAAFARAGAASNVIEKTCQV